AVIDHGGGFAAGQFTEHRLKSGSTLPAPARLQVVFEVAVSGGFVDGFEGAAAQGGAAQVRVQHDARRVDHALCTRPPPHIESRLQTSLDLASQLLGTSRSRRVAGDVDELLSDLG